MNGLRLRWILVLSVGVVCSLAAQTPAWAQAEESWSFILTPQVWVSHIAKNGFVAPSQLGGFQLFATGQPGAQKEPFKVDNESPVDNADPQWGLQLAAQKGRWTLAGSFQYVTFETRTDVFWDPAERTNCCNIDGEPLLNRAFPGDRVAQEFVNTTRFDMDFSVTYAFPDVVRNRLDFSLGGGVKFIYASASREYGNQSPFAPEFGSKIGPALGYTGTGLYLVCDKNDCTDGHLRDRVKTKLYLYGVTMPMSAVVHLTSDAKWLLPLGITPFVGAETRDDRNVVYALNQPDVANFVSPLFGSTVNRLDGTKLAYGVTADATIRWIVSDTLSAYAGGRVQFIQGHEKYLAYGPLLGMSVRFGGK